MQILSILLFVIFLTLGGLHFYWAAGGYWGFAQALPTNQSGQRLLNPSTIDCIVVGIGLTVFGLFYLLRAKVVYNFLPNWINIGLGWIIPLIFSLRAVGDFKYVGFFKTVSNTTFAQMDTMIYSPLCLGLAVIGFLVLWYL